MKPILGPYFLWQLSIFPQKTKTFHYDNVKNSNLWISFYN